MQTGKVTRILKNKNLSGTISKKRCLIKQFAENADEQFEILGSSGKEKGRRCSSESQ